MVPIVHLILINLFPGVYIPFFLTLFLNPAETSACITCVYIR